jgi:hypothetical protein
VNSFLLHHRGPLAAAVDLVGRADRQQLLVDDGQLLLARDVAEGELVAEAEDLAVDVEYFAAGLVADGEVVAPGENSFPSSNIARLVAPVVRPPSASLP